ncbi:MAG: glycosyltransferase family 2 protein [Chloroherpetonaceae bacterium]|nr:glycosyltransferase family 2 protein [Chloroherpetonaceae bacterium]
MILLDFLGQIVFTVLSVIGFILTFFSILLLVLSLSSRIELKRRMTLLYPNPRLVILIAAYKPNSFLLTVLHRLMEARALLRHPNLQSEIVVLFQDTAPELVAKAKALPITVLEASFQHLSGNPYHHALRYAVSQIDEMDFHPSHLLLLDKDNLPEINYFEKLLPHLHTSADLIQGKRLPLNVSNASEQFDFISEHLNDRMFRLGLLRLGGELEISGSGVTFRYERFREAIQTLDSRSPGMDKSLMIELYKKRFVSIFAPELVVYEEKSAEPTILEKQRIRWLGAQYFNAFCHALDLILSSLREKWIAPLLYLIVLLRPPRSVHALIAWAVTGVEIIYFFIYSTFPNHLILGVPFGIFNSLCLIVSALLISESPLVRKSMLQMALHLPDFGLRIFRSTLQGLKRENQGKFIHTVHHFHDTTLRTEHQ